MVLRFSERVAIDDEDGIAFGAYLGGDGGTREAVLRIGPEGLVEIAVEGAAAPGGGRYAGFGPWPTVGARRRDGVRRGARRRTWAARRLRRGSGTTCSRVATMGETLPEGGADRSLRAQCRRRGGSGWRADVRDGGEAEGERECDLVPLSGVAAMTVPHVGALGTAGDQFMSNGGYSRNTLAAVTSTCCVTVRGGSVFAGQQPQRERQHLVAVTVHVVGDRAQHHAAAVVGIDLLLLAGAAMDVAVAAPG